MKTAERDEAVVSRVIACVQGVLAHKGVVDLKPVTGGTNLDSVLGLDSLDYAELVVRLGDEFGFDPFAARLTHDLATVADLAALYEREE